MALDGVSFGGKFAAYERYMQGAKTRMGLTPEQTREQFARYSEGLQYDQIKADKKAQGKAFGRELAAENAKARPAQAKPQATQVKPSEYYLDLAKRNEASYGNLDRHQMDLAVGVRRNENNYGKRNVHLQGAAKESYRKRYQHDLENLINAEKDIAKNEGKALVPFGSKAPVSTKAQDLVQMESNIFSPDPKKLRREQKRLYRLEQLEQGKKQGIIITGTAIEKEPIKEVAAEGKKLTAEEIAEQKRAIAARKEELKANKGAFKGKTSGVVEADNIAVRKRLENAEKELSKQKDIAARYKKLAQNKGKVSGVVIADEIASKKIEGQGKKGGKIAKFFKGKGGKALLIGAAVAAIATGVGLLIHNNKKKAQEEEAAEMTNILPPAEEQETTPAAPPVDEVQQDEPAEEVVPAAPAEAEENPEDGLYTVVKGDCVWNIAKAKLARDLGRKPTNAEILKETHRLMDINPQLKWEPDHYHVMIKPGEKLNIAG